MTGSLPFLGQKQAPDRPGAQAEGPACPCPAHLTRTDPEAREAGCTRCSYIRLSGTFLLVLSAAGDQRNQAGSILTCSRSSSQSSSLCHQEHPNSLPSRGPEAEGPQHKPRAPLLSCWPFQRGLPDLSNLPGASGALSRREQRCSDLAGTWERRAPGAAWPVGARTPQGTPGPNVLPWWPDEALQPCGRQPSCLFRRQGSRRADQMEAITTGKVERGGWAGPAAGRRDAGGEPSLPS